MNQAKLNTIHDLMADVERLNSEIDKAKAEAVKEFAERLCEGRVLNDPVLIAVRTEVKMLEEENG